MGIKLNRQEILDYFGAGQEVRIRKEILNKADGKTTVKTEVLGRGFRRTDLIDQGFDKVELKQYARKGWLQEFQDDRGLKVYYVPRPGSESGP